MALNFRHMKPIVDVQDVSFAYQDAPILQNITFQVSEGEFIGIIGPNGGGKTTLLKLLMGFLEPTSGAIQILGAAPSKMHAQLAYVPQVMRYDKQFPISVFELVLTGRLSNLPWYGRYKAQDKEAAENALDLVGLSHIKNAPFGTLSGGQAQRALIARALVSAPKLLLLDEPTASVDPKAEADIYSLLSKLRTKMTILMVTHDLNTAIGQVDRVFCVQRQLISLMPQEVCEHFAMGLYHTPLLKVGNKP